MVELQRRRLLSAIMEVLGDHGYEGATVARICKRAGVSRRTFYGIYDDREGCFLDAFEHAVERLTDSLRPAFESGKRWRERVRGALEVLLTCFETEPGIARLCLIETLKGGPEVLARRWVIIDALARAIDAGRGEARGADLPPLTAESLVGGAILVIQARLVGSSRFTGLSTPGSGGAEEDSLVTLVNPLMGMIVLPYLGPAAARRELDRPASIPVTKKSSGQVPAHASDPFRGLPLRITFRTARVLATVAAHPNASNRQIGQGAGVSDQGQMSKLLRRLEKAGLIDNHGEGQVRGEANAWRLTTQGHGVLHAVGGDGA